MLASYSMKIKCWYNQSWDFKSRSCDCVCVCVRLFVTPWTIPSQALLSMGFSSQEHWSGLPCLGSSRSRDQTHVSYVSCIGRWILYHLCHLGSPQKLWLEWVISTTGCSSEFSDELKSANASAQMNQNLLEEGSWKEAVSAAKHRR